MSEIIQGLLSDYIKVLAKEHPTAARLVQAYASQELQSAATPVPDDNAKPEAE